MEAALTCVKCRAPLISTQNAETAGIAFNTLEPTWCPNCGARTIVEVYPALFRVISHGGAGEKIGSAEEAACFYHPQKRASVPCDSCGRFLCALCDVELNGQHICPNCLQTGKKKGRLKNFENERVLYDQIALTAAVLPAALMVTYYFTAVTAPLALYLSIRNWKTPSSVVPRHTHLRFVIAIIFASLQIAAWIGYFIYRIHS